MSNIQRNLLLRTYIILIFSLLSLCLSFGYVPHAFSDVSTGRFSSLPIPRFISLKTEPVYMRRGPGIRYPILWVYQKRGLPLEIIEEFNTWRKVRDPNGSEGWIHQSMLSGKRSGIITNDLTELYKGLNSSSEVLAKIEKNVVLSIISCPQKIDFCNVKLSNLKGWIKKNNLWGIYSDELID